MRKYNKSINTRTKIHLSVQFHLFWTEGHAMGRGGCVTPIYFRMLFNQLFNRKWKQHTANWRRKVHGVHFP